MPKVTEDYRAARRLEISQAALRCFVRKGFQGASMADIIAESGLSAGAIYGHFKSKDELIEAAIHEVVELHEGLVSEADEDGALPSPHQVLRRFIIGLTGRFEDLGLLVQVWAEATTDASFRRTAAGAAAGLQAIFERYALAWLTRPGSMVEGDPAGLSRRYGAVMLGACQGYIVQSALLEDFDAESYLAGLEILRLP
ncbi:MULTISPECIES: TetR/AcrR family transcriptional regulator [Micrococcaceae]|nr:MULTISPECIES: TetR/AcrR family transcriptional regulator [Micrococcaceae]PCC24068.1 TetR/AcrR family transcriptional regulator [Glutamicibacter sp. BW78]